MEPTDPSAGLRTGQLSAAGSPSAWRSPCGRVRSSSRCRSPRRGPGAAGSLAAPGWRSRERAGWAAVPRATRVSGSP